ncbi:sulfotransferase domain-containing protein [Roseivivax sp. GX 12232]|uniref:sulfotransferase domain-containing protein n=1 Tax=Roseivivax sp. GX 12232 TaxID=2900547 RepID=UPI001E3C53A4|nr:sulfotransferase domain-containing protein [Roseivivax sp. GX 12232]MCE0505472.1 sulfotransferase domain-containing protein [Roseivivax sp. GX 12232]
MPAAFDYFVVFAEMRTGSNFLETNLNALPSVTCHGEAFNPHFIGYPNSEDILGITRPERDAKPERLLAQIRKATQGLGGFRYFHDHDPRVLTPLLEDPRCAKIVLTRNPVDSYVSWKIAQQTGQWKLTNVRRRREEKARFDPREFEAHLAAQQGFQVRLLNALQRSGQTAFYIAYEDLQDLEVMNGLAAWLGVPERLEALDRSLKVQNPKPLSEKVENYAEMEQALVRLDGFNLARTPNFEPRRGPLVPSYVAAARADLLYMPIRSGPEAAVTAWLAALDGVDEDALVTKFSQNTLRHWKRARPGHRSFTVIRHPLARAHDAFCTKILATGPGSFGKIRAHLVKTYGLPLKEDPADYSLEDHREAFTGFLRFCKANLAGQTPIRTDGHWASQSQTLLGMAEFTFPDMVIREEEMAAYLPALALQVGCPAAPDPEPRPTQAPFGLAQVYDDTLEALAQEAYARDYTMFGFSDWG